MKRSIMVAGVLAIVVTTMGWAQTNQPVRAAGGGQRGPTAEDIAKHIADRQAQIQKELARVDEEAAHLKDSPDAAAMVQRLKTGLAALAENLNAESDAAKAGDTAKVKTLLDQGRDLEASCGTARYALQYARQAAEIRSVIARLSPAAGDVEASRLKYVDALNAQAAYYDKLAQNPPPYSREFRGNAQSGESALKLARDRAKVECDYQNSVAQFKTAVQRFGDDAAAKTACEKLTEQAAAVRDAQLKVADAQASLSEAVAAAAKAEAAMNQAKQEQMTLLRGTVPQAKARRGKDASNQ